VERPGPARRSQRPGVRGTYDPSSVSPIRVGNAPCSYGAFEITVGRLPNVPQALGVLDSMAKAGYEGTELGPPGYLGDAAELGARLRERGLELVGGYIPIRFSEPEALEEDLHAMAATLNLFEAAGATNARPVLADAGSPLRTARPGQAALDRSLGLDDAGWRRFADGVARAADAARARGFAPTFHHHTATHVEAPWEIERLLELTDVGLLLDTGHLALGGGDPVEALQDWSDRIDHLHVKDCRRSVLEGVIADAADMEEAWRRRVFCELGTGDVDLPAFFAAVSRTGYSGWLVVEQDVIPAPGEDASEAMAAQARNRRWLADVAGV
jgi:inosose dehydratase